jgi:hypothetical protein
MKKLTAIFTIVALLMCMFTFTPTASAAEMYDPNGDTVSTTKPLSQDDSVEIYFELKCNNGWLDGTNGHDYVRAKMSTAGNISISCSASIDVEAEYISNGRYVTESDYETRSTLGPSGFSVTVIPNTDLLSSGYASYNISTSSYGHASASLSASCPTAVK